MQIDAAGFRSTSKRWRMELLYISPEFPPNYANFILQLNRLGVRVWAVGEADFYEMAPDLRSALQWYVRTDLRSPAAVDGAIGELFSVQSERGLAPHFDLVESHNEQWLRLEAHINQTRGIDGLRPADMDRLKKKSAMKQLFRDSGLLFAPGEPVRSEVQATELAGRLGYPVILKPDEGVGSAGIHRIEDQEQLLRTVAQLNGEYLLEKFVDAPIVTYDGLVNYSGEPVFENSLVYADGVLDCVLGKETFFYVNRQMPARLAEIGRRLVRSLDIRRKFFHFEFFRIGDDYMPIEINCRPPGGAIVDMMNYSTDGDLYAAYARMISGANAGLCGAKKYYCAYIGRRNRPYALTHADVLARFEKMLVEHGSNPAIYWDAMGRYRYIFRSASEAELLQTAAEILKTGI